MSVDFETPAARVIEQFSGKDEEQFRIPADLPDIAFQRRLSIQGRMRFFQGSIGASIGNIITITPAVGETFFILKASVSGSGSWRANLINDGMTRADIAATGVPATFDIGIDSLVGNGIKTITINTVTAISCLANLTGWVENTSRIRDVSF